MSLYNIKPIIKKLNKTGVMRYKYSPLLNFYTKEGIVDKFDTKKLNLDLKHPVDVKLQRTYDDSVNIIFNDNKNNIKLVNAGFRKTQNNTYEFIDRSNTNVYEDVNFEQDTNLIKYSSIIPTVNFLGVINGGVNKVGNYEFYFKYIDLEGNESNIIAHSKTVSLFKGINKDPFSIDGGIKDENSGKEVLFVLNNIDKKFKHISVYYTRSTSDLEQNSIVTAHKIDKKFKIEGDNCFINIKGVEKIFDIPLEDLNIDYFLPKSAKTIEYHKNVLFLGNVKHCEENLTELKKLTYQFVPSVKLYDEDSIGNVDNNYIDTTEEYMYYNIDNIYHKVGYFNDEIYRFGAFYILKSGKLTSVYNISGGVINENISYESINFSELEISDNYFISSNIPYHNDKGVCKIVGKDHKLIGLKFDCKKEVITKLKNLGVVGIVFVRQERIPNFLGTTLVVPKENYSKCPLLPLEDGNYIERFVNDERVLSNYNERLSKDTYVSSVSYCGLFPMFNIPLYNDIFSGGEFFVKKISDKRYLERSSINERIYNYYENTTYDDNYTTVKIKVVNELNKCYIGNSEFKTKFGNEDEVWRVNNFKYYNKDKTANNIIRGVYSTYLGITGDIDVGLYDIYFRNPKEDLKKEFDIRMSDSSKYIAITHRSYIDNFDKDIFGGDCYISRITLRLNRNFTDPTVPNNDIILDENTWKNNYDPYNEESYIKINRTDINSVPLGSWVTFKVKSSYNLSIRSSDESDIKNNITFGKGRSFYPLNNIDPNYTLSDSYILNKGFNVKGTRSYFDSSNLIYLNNNYQNRIFYSNKDITSYYENGIRKFNPLDYIDIDNDYGSITKLIKFKDHLCCVLEHGIVLIPVNTNVIIESNSGSLTYLSKNKIIDDRYTVISDTYGSQWEDSIISTDLAIYGIDTIAKKIWRFDSDGFAILSDFKVQKLLNDSISLLEKENGTHVGIRNVKTHYNAFKHDVMFTFYDNINTYEESAFNICYNELSKSFITQYSWLPLESVNIDNVFFSFDRKYAKTLARCVNYSNMLDVEHINNSLILQSSYGLTNVELEEDIYGFYKYHVVTKQNNKYIITCNNIVESTNISKKYNIPASLLNVKLSFNSQEEINEQIFNINSIIKIQLGILNEDESLNIYKSVDFWKHGYSGIIKTEDEIKPCNWYGEQHPFEYEFVVNNNPAMHKIFDNISIISNNSEPESFHYHFIGDSFTFNEMKPLIYAKQEYLKNTLRYADIDIVPFKGFEKNKILDVIINPKTMFKKINIYFPQYYSRIDNHENMYDKYSNRVKITTNEANYDYITGTEIVKDEFTKEYSFVNHVKAVNMRSNSDDNYYTSNRRYGNMIYKEDCWKVQINPINYVQVEGNNINKIIHTTENIDKLSDIDTTLQYKKLNTDNRKEIKIKDKYLKIRVRYKGDKVTTISAIQTNYSITAS